MERLSDPSDFAEADAAADADPSPLRRLILAQEEEPGGAAVALLTDAAIAQIRDEVGARVEASGPRSGDLFALDAYLLQSALGEQLLGGPVAPLGDDWDAVRADALLAAPLVALNFHEVPRDTLRAVEDKLRRLADLGPAAGMVGLYDGYREQLEVVEICERLGLRAHVFPVFDEPDDEPGAAAIRDDELADLARRGHELAFHTAGHVRADSVTEATVRHEVHDVLDRLEALAGRPPRLGAWRGGTRHDPALLGDRTLRDRGVRHLVSNWSVETVPPPESES